MMSGSCNKSLHTALHAALVNRVYAGNERHTRKQGGFTLVETMLALAILVLMTGIVAMGVPVAMRTYTQAVNGSNAQLLLATTATELRNELGMAQLAVTETGEGAAATTQVNGNGTLKYYVSGDGYWASINNREEGGLEDVVRRLYMNDADPGAELQQAYEIEGSGAGGEADGAAGESGGEGGEADTRTLIGDESLGAAKATSTTRGNLNIAVGDITLKKGVFTVNNLIVYDTDKTNPLAKIDKYYIRALMLPESA